TARERSDSLRQDYRGSAGTGASLESSPGKAGCRGTGKSSERSAGGVEGDTQFHTLISGQDLSHPAGTGVSSHSPSAEALGYWRYAPPGLIHIHTSAPQLSLRGAFCRRFKAVGLI